MPLIGAYTPLKIQYFLFSPFDALEKLSITIAQNSSNILRLIVLAGLVFNVVKDRHIQAAAKANTAHINELNQRIFSNVLQSFYCTNLTFVHDDQS